MKHRGGKQWPSQDMTVLPDIITRILLPYKKLLPPKDDCRPIFHLYNRTGKKVVPFKFKIHCPYKNQPLISIGTRDSHHFIEDRYHN